MNYPSLPEVEKASKRQLGIWLRRLDSPGMSAVNAGVVNNEDHEVVRVHEAAILARINARFQEQGGWNSRTSKRVGLGKR